MTARQHTLFGGATALLLSPILGFNAIPFWIGSVLIDADHYLEFIYHNRLTDFSVKRMYDYHSALGGWFPRPEFLNLSVFHTVECLSLLYISGSLLGLPSLKATVYGMLFHVFLDAIYLFRRGFLSKRAHSIIEFLTRKELMRQYGLHPRTVCNEALQTVYRNMTERIV